MNLNIRLSGNLEDFIKEEIHCGNFESASELVRGLIRKYQAEQQEQRFAVLKGELQLAFAQNDTLASPMSAEEFFAKQNNRF